MKRIVQVAVVAFACSAGAAFAEQSDQQVQNQQIAQASTGGSERAAVSVQEAQPRRTSIYDVSELAAKGPYPSRGGPLDD